MSRGNRRADEMQFGSDSFLDIVANMVGIIIILIVVVGLRVRSVPADAEDAKNQARLAEAVERNAKAQSEFERQKADWLAEKERIEEANRRRIAEHERQKAQRAAELERRRAEDEELARQKVEREAAVRARTDENARRERLLSDYRREAEAIRAEAAELFQQVSLAEKERERRLALEEQGRRDENAAARELDRLRALAAHQEEVLAQKKETWETVGRELEELRRQIAQLKAKPRATKQWVHYATAIARKVDQKEVHFRCLGGRIADIHLEALLERVKERIVATNNAANTITGVVGPIEGFRMSFVATGANRSLSDLAHNPFVYRIQLAGWEIHGESPRLGETKEQCLRSGSRLREELVLRPPHVYAVTLWVYPDSFETASAVRAFLHERGYNVALRPLPMDVPIAGSPWGSASRVQ